jgi:alkaline phosphatase
LLIVAPDHETGGFAINGPYGELSQAGDIIQDGWTSSDHTACDTLIWSQGPGSDKLGKALDNIDLFTVMVDIIQ